MDAPAPALAPVIPPVTVPNVQEKLLAALEVKEIFGLIPLQAFTLALFVTTGMGFTVIVTVAGDPAQEPAVDVGVTIYSIKPAVALLGLVSVWLIDVPEPAEAPLMLPVLVPNVQLKLLATLDVNETLGLVPLQIVALVALVSTGTGFTVTVKV